MSLQNITPHDFTTFPFRLIGKEWMLIAAQHQGKTNAMTASWGALGVLWGKNVALIFIRKSRYTKMFVDNSDTFSLNFFNHEQYKEMLSYMGTVSGKHEDKIQKAKLHVKTEMHTPYFQEAQLVMLSKKLSKTPITPAQFIDSSIEQTFYADNDYHDLYVGEITAIFRQS